jgi:hypothetical protein
VSIYKTHKKALPVSNRKENSLVLKDQKGKLVVGDTDEEMDGSDEDEEEESEEESDDDDSD